MQLFYCEDITGTGFATLDTEESRHAVRVLRMREGDEINVTDGRGHLYGCRIVDADERACQIECVAVDGRRETAGSPVSGGSPQAPHPPRLTLAVAPTKNPSRMEWLVEKAVEMGVAEVVLLQCDHSERSFLKTDRLEKLAVSAMKQSLRTVLPPVHPVVALDEWIGSPQPQVKLIAHCEADEPRVPLASAMKAGADTVILIGPEGDFSPEEISLARRQGFVPVSFGASRLRTETAALYAVAAFNFINDRLS